MLALNITTTGHTKEPGDKEMAITPDEHREYAVNGDKKQKARRDRYKER